MSQHDPDQEADSEQEADPQQAASPTEEIAVIDESTVQDRDSDDDVTVDDVSVDDVTVDDVSVDDDSADSETQPGSSIFDLFEPPPEIDPNRFGPIPVVPDAEDSEHDAIAHSGESELAESELAESELAESELAESELAESELAESELADDAEELDEVIHSAGLFDSVPDSALLDDSPPKRASLSVDEVLASVEQESPSTDLPHWTEPATGSVPAVLGSNSPEGWSDLTGPQWRGEGSGVDDGDDLAAVFGDTEGVSGHNVSGELIKIDDADQEPAGMPIAAGAPQREALANPAKGQPIQIAEVADDIGGRNIPQAIAVGVIFAGLALLAFRIGETATLALIVCVAVLAAVEAFNAMRMAGLHPATLLGIVAVASLPLATYYRGEPGFMLVMGLSVIFGAIWYLVGADQDRPALNLGLTLLGISWIGGLSAFGILMILLPDGISMLLAAVIVTAAYDIGAFAGGKAFGSRPFHPASPNKTWEGTIVGATAAVVAGVVVGILDISPFSGNLVDAAMLGLVGAVLAPIGDLTESMIKRDLGVKDMGSLLPGHGGILDRLDGLIFVLPGVYFLARMLDFV